jgi:hypothetical protein
MSTALIYCSTPEGFVIGADGRGFNELKQQAQSDTERKIFAFENQAASIVFVWTGIVTARIPLFDFSLIDQTYDLLPQLDFSAYFAQELNAKLKERLRMLGAQNTGESAVGTFLSYRKGDPWISEIVVFKNGRTWDCRVDEGAPHGEITIVSGPPDAKLETEKPQSLIEATNLIKTYLDDCVAHPTDKIGGHVHIAKFTPGGFEWIVPPII